MVRQGGQEAGAEQVSVLASNTHTHTNTPTPLLDVQVVQHRLLELPLAGEVTQPLCRRGSGLLQGTAGRGSSSTALREQSSGRPCERPLHHFVIVF